VLAFARFRKAMGVPAREALANMVDVFSKLKKRMRDALAPVVEAMRRAGEAIEEADRQAEAIRLKVRTLERPGGRQGRPPKKRTRPE
jgi:hypothetical protein